MNLIVATEEKIEDEQDGKAIGMNAKQEATRLLYEVIDALNTELPDEERLEKSADAVLLGDSGTLDSVTLVNLIVAAEQKIEEELGVTISLADERAMSQESSPLSTVGNLVDYISLLLSEHDGT